MKPKYSYFVCLFASLLLFCFGGSSGGKIQCIAKERQALLEFKHAIKVDQCGLLTSWVGQECCQWGGIRCSNHSGHVITLDVSGAPYDNLDSEFSYLEGTISPSLVKLKHLNDLDSEFSCLEGTISPSLVELKHLIYLDLSYGDFHGQPIPSFIGSLVKLKYLYLSHVTFSGEIPHQLANLTSLVSLDLSSENFPGLHVKNLRWISHLTLLTDINFLLVDLSLATDWMQIVNNLPSLKNLHMAYCELCMPMSPSLLEYTNSSTTLHTLSLQGHNFTDTTTRILEWVSNFTRLSSTFSYLDLSFNDFSGPIPGSLGNMHCPLYLVLSYNSFEGPIPETISNLTNLAYLDLSSNMIKGTIPERILTLKNLAYLDLSSNMFEGPIPEKISKLKHLVHLYLTGNKFQGSKWNPEALGSLCNLKMLSLAKNNITNELSTIIKPLSQCLHRSLVSLNIQYNRIWGSLPDEIGTFSSLRELYLGTNQLNGTISPSLGQLSMLEKLVLSSNSLKGTISDHYLSNLSRLTVLDLSDNPELVLNLSANWVPPFQLDYIHLRSCKMGPYFPKWLLTQTNFSYLDISNANISDTIPTLFWDLLTSNLHYMNMSKNMIDGSIPDILISLHNSPQIDLSSNSFHGGIPSFLINTSLLILNDNKFSDLAPFFCPKTKTTLSILRLSNNKLSGELPSCWGYFDQLTSLHLDSNNISGKITESIGNLTRLEALHLRNNSISGKLPVTLQNCVFLNILDLSHNSLSGHIPHWVGNLFPSLVIFSLRSNNLLGGVPLSLCQLSRLQILDFSSNQLSGFIPKCICNLTAMSFKYDGRSYSSIDIDFSISGPSYLMASTYFPLYVDSAWIMWKGKEWSFANILNEVKAIDMSNNELEGPIPDGISRLAGLKSLDLSRNRLNGSITQDIGNLTSLEYLNLSRNLIYGEIPESLSTVSSLEILDVSYNNLSGRIPHGTQLQGFKASSYIGNSGLCGEPLLKCPGDPTPANSLKEDKSSQDYHDLFPGLYISMVLGFIVGFWGVCGTLVIKRSLRHAFFQFFDDIKEKLLMLVAVNKARILRRNI